MAPELNAMNARNIRAAGTYSRTVARRRPGTRPRLGKHQAEMQEHGGRQQARHQVSEIDHLVEIVELAGVVEAERNETRQAENIKMLRLLRAAAPEVDEQPDHQVRGAQPHTGKGWPGRAAARRPPAWPSVPPRGFVPGTWPGSRRRSVPGPWPHRWPGRSSRHRYPADGRPGGCPHSGPGCAGFTYKASTLPCRSTQITPSSGRRKRFCC